MARYIDVRAILEEKFKGNSNNSIVAQLHCSKYSVQDVWATAKDKGIDSKEAIPSISDKELYKMFFRDRNVQDEGIGEVDYCAEAAARCQTAKAVLDKIPPDVINAYTQRGSKERMVGRYSELE